MTLRPCIDCGDPSAGTRCPHCTRQQQRDTRRDHIASINKARWKRLSAQVRRAMPWCLDCHNTKRLSADHILPAVDYPELWYSIENLVTRCQPCNGRRGDHFTEAEAHDVLARLQAAQRRRPTPQGRERVNAALRAVQTARGEGVHDRPHRSEASRRAGYTPPVDSR